MKDLNLEISQKMARMKQIFDKKTEQPTGLKPKDKLEMILEHFPNFLEVFKRLFILINNLLADFFQKLMENIYKYFEKSLKSTDDKNSEKDEKTLSRTCYIKLIA